MEPDEQVREWAREPVLWAFGVRTIQCAICKHVSLFVMNRERTNAPVTCGRLMCGAAAKEPWARKVT